MRPLLNDVISKVLDYGKGHAYLSLHPDSFTVSDIPTSPINVCISVSLNERKQLRKQLKNYLDTLEKMTKINRVFKRICEADD